MHTCMHMHTCRCVFSETNMYAKDSRDVTVGKEGSGRVGVYRMTGLTHVYTLECNYNMGRKVNRLTHPHVPSEMDQNRSLSPQPPLRCLSPKYTPDCWRAVGKALAISALDMVHVHVHVHAHAHAHAHEHVHIHVHAHVHVRRARAPCTRTCMS